MITDKV